MEKWGLILELDCGAAVFGRVVLAGLGQKTSSGPGCEIIAPRLWDVQVVDSRPIRPFLSQPSPLGTSLRPHHVTTPNGYLTSIEVTSYPQTSTSWSLYGLFMMVPSPWHPHAGQFMESGSISRRRRGARDVWEGRLVRRGWKNTTGRRGQREMGLQGTGVDDGYEMSQIRWEEDVEQPDPCPPSAPLAGPEITASLHLPH
ncbi:hypothetical protein CPB84DRAFT_1777770 [Gymnopilus junonius]|uniref:Uncharacterized protein n=1 Tax=Gymnopilus junonius TaxID=109634 RepID=A0A9P5TNR2_GYMJU|nr:hypothetical protein CPB84DRAFT_1777770 [Gymnopilus junonius]